MADINTLLGMGISSEEELKALANKLRGQQREGQFLEMSTLAPVAQRGRNMQQSAVDSATQGGALRQARAKQQREQQAAAAKEATRQAEREQDYQRGLEATRLARSQQLADDKTSHQQALELAAPKYGEFKPYINHDTKEIKNVARKGGLTFEQDENGNPVQTNIQGFVPYKEPATGGSRSGISATKYKDMKDKEISEMVGNEDFITNTLLNPRMRTATGPWYDLPKRKSQWTGLAPTTQALGNELNSISLEAVSPYLDKLGVNPTDKDLAVAFDAVPSTSDEPEVWTQWYKRRYIPSLERAFQRAGIDGSKVINEMKNKASEMKKLHESTKTSFTDDVRDLFSGDQVTNLPSAGKSEADSLVEKYRTKG